MIIAGAAKLFLKGDAQTLVLILAPAIGGAITYFGKQLSFLVTDPIENMKRRRERQRDNLESKDLYEESRRTLVRMRDKKGITKSDRRGWEKKIHDLDEMYSASVTERFRARLSKSDRES
ncbi:MAG: hypothetical protein QOF33_2195 [Thermomicrobiales bacterium]|nr:hypothetical protein [Thermomicrobiales bacterium]